MPNFTGRAQDFLSQNFGTGAQLDATNQLFQGLLGSQGGQALLGGGMQAGQVAQNSLLQNLGRSGLSQTGIGRVAAGLSGAVPAMNRQNIMQQIFGQSQQLGAQNLQGRMQALPAIAEQMRMQSFLNQLLQLLPGIGGGVALGLANRR